MGEVIRRFEKANPDIRVKWTNISGYGNLNTAIQDGYGTPDVAQNRILCTVAVRGLRPIA